jgi:hypothetical protein
VGDILYKFAGYLQVVGVFALVGWLLNVLAVTCHAYNFPSLQ